MADLLNGAVLVIVSSFVGLILVTAAMEGGIPVSAGPVPIATVKVPEMPGPVRPSEPSPLADVQLDVDEPEPKEIVRRASGGSGRDRALDRDDRHEDRSKAASELDDDRGQGKLASDRDDSRDRDDRGKHDGDGKGKHGGQGKGKDKHDGDAKGKDCKEGCDDRPQGKGEGKPSRDREPDRRKERERDERDGDGGKDRKHDGDGGKDRKRGGPGG